MKQFVMICVVIFTVVILLMYFWQRQLIYFPSHETPTLAEFQATDMHVVRLQTKDGLTLSSWYKPAKTLKPTLLYLHGNAGHIGYRMPLARALLNAGVGVFLLEYRGYGGNPGSPSEQGLYQDAKAAMQYLIASGVKAENIIIFGESLGTGVATRMAIQFPIGALILQSPLTSLAAVSRYHYPWLFLKPWDKFDSLSRMKAIHAPLLILHGKEDEVVPYGQAEAIFQQANEPKRLVSFEKGEHNNLLNYPEFIKEIIGFIMIYCGKRQFLDSKSY